MLISKNGKRLMSYLLTIVMVLTGFVYAPKAEAADDVNVSVLGATLRFSQNNDNNGTQSMRIGIQINKATQAKACAIELKVENTSVIVGTDGFPNANKTGNYMNAKNEKNDSVVYAVVVTGIPQDRFNEEISVTGKVVKMDGTIVSSNNGAPDKKTVDGVVQSLKERYPSVNIEMVNGTLVKLHKEMKINSLGEDTNGDPDGFKYWNVEGGDAKWFTKNDNDYYCIKTDSKNGKGIAFQNFDWGQSDYLYAADMRKCCDNETSSSNMNKVDCVEYYKSYNEGSAINIYDDWQTLYFTCSADVPWKHYSITSDTPGESYDIKSFKVYKILNVNDFNGYSDQYDPTFPEDAYLFPLTDIGGWNYDKTFNSDGSVTLDFKDIYAQAKFTIPNAQEAKYDTVVVNYKDGTGNVGYILHGWNTAEDKESDAKIEYGGQYSSWLSTSQEKYTISDDYSYITDFTIWSCNPPGTTTKVTITGIAFYRTKFNLSNPTIVGGSEGDTVTINDDGSMTYSKEDGFSGMYFNLPKEVISNNFISVNIEYESTGCEARAYLIKDGNDKNLSNILAATPSPIKGDLKLDLNQGDTANQIFIKASDWNTSFTSFTSLTIKKITVTYNTF